MRKISKILGSLVLVCALLFSTIPATFAENADVWENDVSVWDGTYPAVDTSATYSGGNGSSESPYLLKSATDLAQLAVNVNAGEDYSYYHKYFKLCCDIDMNNQPWVGIGSSAGARTPGTAFKGVFDGDNHVIYNFNLESKPSELGRGFFGVTFGATVRNLGIASGTIELTDNQAVGSLIGRALQALTLENCHSGVTIYTTYTKEHTKYSTSSEDDTWTAGGIIGILDGENKAANIQNCVWYGMAKVMDTPTTRISLGGIVGMVIRSNLTVQNVNSIGRVLVTETIASKDNRMSAMIGCGRYYGADASAKNITFTNCYAGGSYWTSNLDRVGAFCGWNHEVPVNGSNNTYYGYTKVIGQTSGTLDSTGFANAEKTETAGLLLGKTMYQTKTVDGSFYVRFLSEMSGSYREYEQVGFDVTIQYNGDEAQKTRLTTYSVYSSILALDETTTPETGKYFIATGISGVPADAGHTVAFTVRPYAIGINGVTIYGESSTVTFTAGEQA